MLSEIIDWNCESLCGHVKSEYLKHSRREHTTAILSRISRMTHERTKTKSEQSTENCEASSKMAPLPRTTPKKLKTQSDETKGNIFNRQWNGGIQKSTFSSMRRMTNPIRQNSVKLGEKRKFEFFTSENHVSESEFKDAMSKRLKSDQIKNIHKRNGLFNEFKPPVYFGEKSIYYSPSFQQNAYLTLNGLSGISMDLSRKLESNDMSQYLTGFNKGRINEKEIKTSNSQTNPTEHVELKSVHHAEQISVSVSKTPQRRVSVEHENFTGSSREFISLDSTKSSFLTLIKEMRQNAKCNLIPCPYCSQTFSKYLDLKNHVQVHKQTGLTRDQQGASVSKSPVPTNGNSMYTPVSLPAARSPRPPSRRQSIGDDGVIRATSVIHFAEKKCNENPRK